MLVGCGSLPRLVTLVVIGDANGDEGVVSLADGLRRGRLPSLRSLFLANAQIGPQGATALAPALTKRALPSLVLLSLVSNSQIGDAGLIALAPSLRQLPKLEELYLRQEPDRRPGPGLSAGPAHRRRAALAPEPLPYGQPDHRRRMCRARRRPPRRGAAGTQPPLPG